MDRGFFRIATSEGTHACQQFLHSEWLRQIIVSPELQSTDTISYLTPRSQNENPARDVAGAQKAQQFETIHSRETDIEHNQIERRVHCLAQCFLSIVSHNRIVSGFC